MTLCGALYISSQSVTDDAGSSRNQLATTFVVMMQFVEAFSHGLSDSQNAIGVIGVPFTDHELEGVRSRMSLASTSPEQIFSEVSAAPFPPKDGRV